MPTDLSSHPRLTIGTIVCAFCGLALGALFVDCANRTRDGREDIRRRHAECRRQQSELVVLLDAEGVLSDRAPRCAVLLKGPADH